MHEGNNYGIYAVPNSISHQKGPLMQVAYNNREEFSAFSACREQLESIIGSLLSPERTAQEHGEVEVFIQEEGTELLRQLLQGYLDVRADTETQCEYVVSPAGQTLNHVRTDTSRNIVSLFGNVKVRRSYELLKICLASSSEKVEDVVNRTICFCNSSGVDLNNPFCRVSCCNIFTVT